MHGMFATTNPNRSLNEFSNRQRPEFGDGKPILRDNLFESMKTCGQSNSLI